MPLLEAGSPAPAFAARTSGGSKVDSASFSGAVVLVFYPGNDTPG